MTEDTAWVIQERPTEKAGYTEEDSEWRQYPSITNMNETENMEPTTLENCLVYLRDDPFSERSRREAEFWIIRVYNLVTQEQILYSDLCHE